MKVSVVVTVDGGQEDPEVLEHHGLSGFVRL